MNFDSNENNNAHTTSKLFFKLNSIKYKNIFLIFLLEERPK